MKALSSGEGVRHELIQCPAAHGERALSLAMTSSLSAEQQKRLASDRADLGDTMSCACVDWADDPGRGVALDIE